MAEAGRRWIDPSPVDSERVRELSDQLGLKREVAEILVRRGRGSPADARRWLRPRPDRRHPAGALPDMQAAARRVERAVEDGETVLVHGDYDADGMCSAALLTRALRRLGADARPFVPHRTEHGYDLGEAGLDRAVEAGASLILTADCGVTAVEPVERARGAGLDVVITDHHSPGPRLPEATAVVNPSRADSEYPFPGLAGVGVAFKLLEALFERAGLPAEELNQHLDLVALGTVADQVPLVDENRILARAGLRALERTRKPGLRALLDVAGWSDGDRLDASTVSYGLAPRLNAVGRIADANRGVRLLLTDDGAEARELARQLERQNRERRDADGRVLEEALQALEERYDPSRDRGVVLWGEDWHPGVIGIAASRIVERIHRPAVLVTFREGVGTGSGRSIDGFHLVDALGRCEGVLERYGGHRMAAGLQVRRSRVEEFDEHFREIAGSELGEADLVPELDLDLRLPLSEADMELHGWLEHLAPFGTGNPRPTLASEGVRLASPSRVGRDGKHLKGRLVDDDGTELEAIGFGMGDRADELHLSPRWDVAYELTADTFRGRTRLQARLEDFRPAGSGTGSDGRGT